MNVSGFGLQTGVSGQLRLEGGSLKPYTGHGRVSLHDGRYTAYGQKLEIERGELAFNGPLDAPNLDVRAVRKMPDVTAGVQLTGQPYRLKSTVFSASGKRRAARSRPRRSGRSGPSTAERRKSTLDIGWSSLPSGGSSRPWQNS